MLLSGPGACADYSGNNLGSLNHSQARKDTAAATAAAEPSLWNIPRPTARSGRRRRKRFRAQRSGPPMCCRTIARRAQVRCWLLGTQASRNNLVVRGPAYNAPRCISPQHCGLPQQVDGEAGNLCCASTSTTFSACGEEPLLIKHTGLHSVQVGHAVRGILELPVKHLWRVEIR